MRTVPNGSHGPSQKTNHPRSPLYPAQYSLEIHVVAISTLMRALQEPNSQYMLTRHLQLLIFIANLFKNVDHQLSQCCSRGVVYKNNPGVLQAKAEKEGLDRALRFVGYISAGEHGGHHTEALILQIPKSHLCQ